MKLLFIYNPESGKGKIVKELPFIKIYLKEKGFLMTIKRTTKVSDAYNFAKASQSYKMVLVAGGDGTINEVVNGLMELKEKPLLGYIPTGTVNDVGYLIGMSKNIKKSLKIIFEEAFFKKLDITKINDKYFLYVGATGIFTKSSYDLKRSDKKRFGALAYFMRGSKELFKDYKMAVDIKYDGGRIRGPYSLLLFLNGPRVGGFKLKRLKSYLDDGLIEGRFFKREPGMLLRLFGFFITRGRYNTSKNTTFRSSEFLVEIDKDSEWNIDGEYAFKGSAVLTVQKKALMVAVNKKRKKMFSS